MLRAGPLLLPLAAWAVALAAPASAQADGPADSLAVQPGDSSSVVLWAPVPGVVVALADSAALGALAVPPAPVARQGRLIATGVASYYGERFRGRRTASGQRFDPDALTAAHLTLPFGTRLRVTSVRTGRSVEVRVNDRGPHIRGRILDLSKAAARRIGLMQRGTGQVRIERL